MENELISNEDLQRIQAQQALHSATSTSLSSFLASTEDEIPVTTEEAINTVSEDIAEHNALVVNYTSSVNEALGTVLSGHSIITAFEALPRSPFLLTATTSKFVLVTFSCLLSPLI